MQPTKRIDYEVSHDTTLTISDIPMVLKHVNKLSRIVDGFVFAFIEGDAVRYDTVKVIREANGRRLKIHKLAIAPIVLERIRKHQYQRWYVRCGNKLHPLQQVKPSVIEESFYFMVSADPRYRTQTAYIGETLFIRKKPLLACRSVRPGWGVTLPTKLLAVI